MMGLAVGTSTALASLAYTAEHCLDALLDAGPQALKIDPLTLVMEICDFVV